MKREIRSRKFWEQAVSQAEASSERRADVAKALGVTFTALRYWIYKIRSEKRSDKKPRLIPVRVRDAEAPQYGQIELVVNGVIVRFSSDASPEYVAQLAGALRTC